MGSRSMKPVSARKRSAVVRLGLTTAVAFTLRCGGPTRVAQRCVDDTGRVVDDRYCEQNHAAAPLPYHWYYGGAGFYPGQYASGGANQPIPDAEAVRTSSPGFSPSAVSTSSGVVRGGFGATGDGAASGE